MKMLIARYPIVNQLLSAGKAVVNDISFVANRFRQVQSLIH
jgi:hypothetical protein